MNGHENIMNKHFLHNFFALVFLFVLLVGCSKNVPMGGKVTFSDNGEPLTTGTVVFVSGSQQAKGYLNERGEYKLGFAKAGDGLPPGRYGVYISGADRSEGDRDSGTYKLIPLISAKQASLEKSELTIEVDGSKRRYDIVVDRPK